MVEWFAFGVAALALGLSGRREWLDWRADKSSTVLVEWVYDREAGSFERHTFVVRNVGRAEARDVRVLLQTGEEPAHNAWARWLNRPIERLPVGQSVGMRVGPLLHGVSPPDHALIEWVDGTGQRRERFPVGPEPLAR